jgi:hypothetical protein
VFKELYFWLSELLERVRTNDNPNLSAYIGISFFQCMNILTIYGIINYFFTFNISKSIAIYLSILIYVIISVFNYFYLLRKRDEIEKKFEEYSIGKQRKGKLFLWTYISLTIVIFIFVLTYMTTPKY